MDNQPLSLCAAAAAAVVEVRETAEAGTTVAARFPAERAVAAANRAPPSNRPRFV